MTQITSPTPSQNASPFSSTSDLSIRTDSSDDMDIDQVEGLPEDSPFNGGGRSDPGPSDTNEQKDGEQKDEEATPTDGEKLSEAEDKKAPANSNAKGTPKAGKKKPAKISTKFAVDKGKAVATQNGKKRIKLSTYMEKKKQDNPSSSSSSSSSSDASAPSTDMDLDGIYPKPKHSYRKQTEGGSMRPVNWRGSKLEIGGNIDSHLEALDSEIRKHRQISQMQMKQLFIESLTAPYQERVLATKLIEEITMDEMIEQLRKATRAGGSEYREALTTITGYPKQNGQLPDKWLTTMLKTLRLARKNRMHAMHLQLLEDVALEILFFCSDEHISAHLIQERERVRRERRSNQEAIDQNSDFHLYRNILMTYADSLPSTSKAKKVVPREALDRKGAIQCRHESRGQCTNVKCPFKHQKERGTGKRAQPDSTRPAKRRIVNNVIECPKCKHRHPEDIDCSDCWKCNPNKQPARRQ